jgi:hypothetical protein
MLGPEDGDYMLLRNTGCFPLVHGVVSEKMKIVVNFVVLCNKNIAEFI